MVHRFPSVLADFSCTVCFPLSTFACCFILLVCVDFVVEWHKKDQCPPVFCLTPGEDDIPPAEQEERKQPDVPIGVADRMWQLIQDGVEQMEDSDSPAWAEAYQTPQSNDEEVADWTIGCRVWRLVKPADGSRGEELNGVIACFLKDAMVVILPSGTKSKKAEIWHLGCIGGNSLWIL